MVIWDVVDGVVLTGFKGGVLALAGCLRVWNSWFSMV
jgi:energy-converting hydrogenase Eha subunit G